MGGQDTAESAAKRCFVPTGCAIEACWLTLTAAGAGTQVLTPCVIFPESRRELAEILKLPPGYEPLSLQRVTRWSETWRPPSGAGSASLSTVCERHKESCVECLGN
jgi:hypothetical protein